MGDHTNTQSNFTKLHDTLDSPCNGSLQNESQGSPANITISAAAPSGQPLPPTLPEQTQQDLPSITRDPKFKKITKEEARNQQSEEFKIVFLGDSKVGKSSIIRRFIDNDYREDLVTQSTILEKKLLFCRRAEPDGKIFKIIVCDIGNVDDVDEVEAGIFDQCQVIVIVFDLARDVTVKVAKRDLLKVKRRVGDYPTKFLLAGNKCDLSQFQDISRTLGRGRALANDYDMQYFQTSAKDNNIEITQLFDKVIEKAIEASKAREEQERNRNQNFPAPDPPRNNNNNGSSCVLL